MYSQESRWSRIKQWYSKNSVLANGIIVATTATMPFIETVGLGLSVEQSFTARMSNVGLLHVGMATGVMSLKQITAQALRITEYTHKAVHMAFNSGYVWATGTAILSPLYGFSGVEDPLTKAALATLPPAAAGHYIMSRAETWVQLSNETIQGVTTPKWMQKLSSSARRQAKQKLLLTSLLFASLAYGTKHYVLPQTSLKDTWQRVQQSYTPPERTYDSLDRIIHNYK